MEQSKPPTASAVGEVHESLPFERLISFRHAANDEATANPLAFPALEFILRRVLFSLLYATLLPLAAPSPSAHLADRRIWP